MDELVDRKTSLEAQINEQEARRKVTRISEEQVRKLFSMFRSFVEERNIPECKKFIHNYVDKVVVYKDRVEVIFNVVFSVMKKQEAYKMSSTVRKSTLFKRYGHTA